MNLLDLFFPKRCLGCGRVGRYFCDRCARTIRPIESNEAICPVCEKSGIDGFTHPRCHTKYDIDGLTCCFHYDGIVKKAVKAIKYRYVSDLASEFMTAIPESIVQHVRHVVKKSTVLLPIPLHPSRWRLRGFNQAEVLGNILAESLQVPMCTDILKRVKNTPPQVEMNNKRDRVRNMDHVFSLHTAEARISDSVILFDDVFTTGATMRAAANTLKRKGAPFVWAVTMAR